MSFAMTANQIRNRTKTVTRRFGWKFLKPGDLVCAVEKGMGLKKGEKVKRICTIRIISTRLEPLQAIDDDDLILEGFPSYTVTQFINMLASKNGVTRESIVNRIEFEYI